MYFKESQDATEIEVSPAFKGLLIVTAVAIILLGLFPQILIDTLYFFTI